jgi:hypothetical protein
MNRSRRLTDPFAQLPPSVKEALSGMTARPGYEGAIDRSGLRRELGLWLEPSWRAAQVRGISDGEFARWMSVGVWNLAGDPGVRRMIDEYRALAGESGWVLASARLTPFAAAVRIRAEGLESVLENIEVIQALSGLASSERGPEFDTHGERDEQRITKPIAFD